MLSLAYLVFYVSEIYLEISGILATFCFTLVFSKFGF